MTARRNPDLVRLLVRGRGVGVLASKMADGDGHPYASLVTYACDHRGQPIFLFSALSDHTKNILADNSASLLVEQASRRRNPQTGPRVSLMGKVKPATSPELRARFQARFLARHPDAALYADFADFCFYRMTVDRAHYVGGFARAIWFEPKHILTPAKAGNAIAGMEQSIVEHMNADHPDAVDAYATGLLGRKPGNWKMTGCDCDGIDLRAGGRYGRVNFDNPLTDQDGCRKTLVRMAEQARHAK